MASQRHKLWEQGATAAGEIHAEGVVAPGIAMQVDPVALNVLKAGPPLFNTGQEQDIKPKVGEGAEDITVPIGEPGGPLSGSSLTGAIPEELGPPPGPQPGPEPEPGSEPTLTSIDPATAEMGGADVTMTLTGTNFTETSIIYFNNGAENTEFVSDTELTTVVKPSLVSTAIEVPVWVQQGSVQTDPQTFAFTETAAPEGGEAPAAGRSFPIGPIDVATIEDHVDGIQLTLAGAADVQVGDTVLVEATFNSAINGSYPVLASDGTVIVIDNPVELAAPIDAKGRVTVTG